MIHLKGQSKMGWFIYIGIIVSLFSCTNKEKTLEVFSVDTVKVIECKLYYLDGVLREIRHNKKNKKSFALNSYLFFENGSILTLKKVIGDSILSTTSYYQNGNIEYTDLDFDLNPNDTVVLLHGLRKSYYENGVLKSIGRFERGEKRDTFKYFDEQGKLIQSEVYDEHLR